MSHFQPWLWVNFLHKYWGNFEIPVSTDLLENCNLNQGFAVQVNLAKKVCRLPFNCWACAARVASRPYSAPPGPLWSDPHSPSSKLWWAQLTTFPTCLTLIFSRPSSCPTMEAAPQRSNIASMSCLPKPMFPSGTLCLITSQRSLLPQVRYLIM